MRRPHSAAGTAAAAGSLGAAQTLAFSLGNVDTAGALRGAGLVPGRLSAVGRVTMHERSAEFDGGVAVRGARYRGVPIAGNGDVAFDAAALLVSGADTIAGPAVGTFAGTIRQPGGPGAHYDVRLRVPATDLGPLARVSAPQIPYLVGTLGAEVRLIGRLGEGAARPAVSGTISIPEGSVNGLRFADARAKIRSDATGLDARDASILVGVSRVSFAASIYGSEGSLRLDAPRANLADFNDYFDAGDTFGGVGRVEARFLRRRASFVTNADVAIAGCVTGASISATRRRASVRTARTSAASSPSAVPRARSSPRVRSILQAARSRRSPRVRASRAPPGSPHWTSAFGCPRSATNCR